jgi:hypothetical protein
MSNKNQHFVSQVYLRWFGIPHEDADPKAINLYAIRARKIVQDASIKHQCSGDYFYGRDRPIEDFLQFFETRYGAAMASLERGEVFPRLIEALMQFLFLQYVRTPFQLNERLRLIDEFAALEIKGKRVREGLPEPDSVREMQHQLYIFAKEHSAFEDLAPVILVNTTNSPFISSDNPALVMNKLYSQRYGDPTAGLISAGAIALMPLTPRLALLAYDADVYRPIGEDSVYEIRRESDVDRVNELQVARASDTLFFQASTDAKYVEWLFDKYSSGRKAEWSLTWVGIRDGEDDRFERYRTLKSEDQDSLEPRIQSMSPILPAPSTWPTFLKFKMRPKGWTTGSLVGFVRKAHTNRGRGFREVVLPPRLPRNHSPNHRDVIYQRKSPQK